jgi:hypothetical protein
MSIIFTLFINTSFFHLNLEYLKFQISFLLQNFKLKYFLYFFNRLKFKKYLRIIE